MQMVMEEGQGVTLVTVTGEGDSGKGSSCHSVDDHIQASFSR